QKCIRYGSKPPACAPSGPRSPETRSSQGKADGPAAKAWPATTRRTIHACATCRRPGRSPPQARARAEPRRSPARSGRLVGDQHALQPGDTVLELQLAPLQALGLQLVAGIGRQLRDALVQRAVLLAQLRELQGDLGRAGGIHRPSIARARGRPKVEWHPYERRPAPARTR